MDAVRFLVNGEWRSSPESAAIVNPYTGREEARVFQAGQGDVEDAIGAALSAFSVTRKLQAYERAEILASASAGVRDHREELSRLITTDTGKPISIARGEVDRCVFTFSVAAEEAKRIGGDVLPLDLASHSKNRFGLTRRFPVGPVAAITPFNFPVNLVAHKLAPAIAAGNSIVLKPSSAGARAALALGRILEAAGLPQGVLNIVTCPGGKAGQLVEDERLKLISFTGSPAVGWPLKARAGKKKVVLELGGNAGVIVDRGVDLASTAARIAQGAFASAGQSCIAVQRIFVQEEMFDSFLTHFVRNAGSLPVGDPMLDETVVGPMISEDAAKQVEGWIGDALRDGARLVTGGRRRGAVLEPTILTNVKPEMRVCREEVFAPVATVELFKTIEEAVGRVNNSSFGLQAGIFTNDLAGAFYAFRELEVGGVILNDFPTYRIDHMPYGGIKDSGFGREGLRYAIEEMTEMKLLVANFS